MRRFLRNSQLPLLCASLLFACQDQSDILTPDQLDQQVFWTYTYEPIDGQYIVVVHDENLIGGRLQQLDYGSSQIMMKSESEMILSGHQITSEVKMVFSKTINGFVAKLKDHELLELQNDKRVKYIEQDYLIILGKPPWAGGGDNGESSNGEELPPGIKRVNGGVTYTGNKVAWVIDTGIDLDHGDLNVDAGRGFNTFSFGKDGKSLDDGHGHGTHVAGTIAAIDNEIGVVGVAAGATVIPVKVLNSRGSGSYSGVIAGVDYVGANGSSGDVANMSLGGPVSQALDDAVVAASNKGIKFCLAAGNSSDNASNHSPARANGFNIYTISAMDADDNWASFSNYGNPPIDYCAPGVSIKSTWKGGGYKTISGTSMATPHAAGVLLLGDASVDGKVNGDPDSDNDDIIVH